MSKIHRLIELKSLKGVRAIVEENPGAVNEISSDDSPDQPLHIAAWQNTPRIATFLIAAGADLNARGDRGRTPLHYAANYGSVKVATLLIDAGADLNPKDNAGFTPLLQACYGREPTCIDVAKLLREAGAHADLNSLVSLGETEAVCEVLNRDGDFRAAIKPQALLDDAVIMVGYKTSRWDNISVQESAVEQYKEMFLCLLRAGAEINAAGPPSPPLLSAVQINNVPLVRFLIEQGADVNIRVRGNGKPLHVMNVAWGSDFGEMHKLLKEAGFKKEDE